MHVIIAAFDIKIPSILEIALSDTRIKNFARILVDYSMKVKPGERVGIYTGSAAEPLVQALYALILSAALIPHAAVDFTDQEEILFAHANHDQLEFVPICIRWSLNSSMC